MAGLPKVQEIRSVSLFGLSYVAVYFDDDMDIYFARRLVMERLQEVGDRIPEGYGTPEMGPNTSGLGQVFWYTLERADEELNAAITDMDLRTLQDWTVRLMLRTASGVDDVMSWGGQERQYQVVIDPLNLIKYKLTFKEVMEVIEANNRQVGGQYINQGAEQYLVRGLGLVENEADIGTMVVKVEDGVPVYLRDVATIEQGQRYVLARLRVMAKKWCWEWRSRGLVRTPPTWLTPSKTRSISSMRRCRKAWYFALCMSVPILLMKP